MEKWHTMTAAEVRRTLARQSGNAPARSGQESNDVFRSQSTDFASVLQKTVSDPILPLFVVTAAVAAILLSSLPLLATVLIPVLGAFLSAVIIYSARRSMCATAELLVPFARREAGRKIIRCSSRKLVPGDVIRLREGDIVPADARLIHAENLSVRELIDDLVEGTRVYRRMAKDANKLYSEKDEDQSFRNMVYAGSVVLEGNATAIVTDIGGNTKEGVLHGGVPLPKTDDLPSTVTALTRGLRVFSDVALIAVLPLTFLWLITRRINDPSVPTLAEMFFIILSTAAAVSPLNVHALGEVVIGKTVRMLKNTSGTAVIRADRLPGIALTDTLLSTDITLFADPTYSVRSVFLGSGDFSGDALSSKALERFAHVCEITASACEDYPGFAADFGLTEDIRHLYYLSFRLDSHLSREDFSFDAPTAAAVPGLRRFSFGVTQTVHHADAEDDSDRKTTEERFGVTISDADDFLETCSYYRASDGTQAPVNPPALEKLRAYLAKTENAPRRMYHIATTDSDGLATFEGAICIGTYCQAACAQTVEQMREYGIETKLFVRRERQEIAPEALFGEGVRCADLSELEKTGALDASVQYAAADNSVLYYDNAAHLRLVCDSLADSGRNVLSVISLPRENDFVGKSANTAYVNGSGREALSRSAALRFRSAADQEKGSGIAAAFDAVRLAGAAVMRLCAVRDHIVFSSVARGAAVITAACLNCYSALSSVVGILLAGFIVDLAVAFCLSGCSSVPQNQRFVRACSASGKASVVLTALAGAGVGAAFLPLGRLILPGMNLAVFFSFACVFMSLGSYAANEVLLAMQTRALRRPVLPLAVAAVGAVAVAVGEIAAHAHFSAILALVPFFLGAVLAFLARFLAIRIGLRRDERSKM